LNADDPESEMDCGCWRSLRIFFGGKKRWGKWGEIRALNEDRENLRTVEGAGM